MLIELLADLFKTWLGEALKGEREHGSGLTPDLNFVRIFILWTSAS